VLRADIECVIGGDFIRARRNSGLRKEASARKLDPNVWFDNVERMAAEHIGRETVQYVSNIYKYYIAYSLVEDDIERSLRKAAGSKKGS
jgi:membrane-bound lytic murein transglycosylase MltF